MALIIKQGGTSANTFVISSNGEPVDLTGATFNFLIKDKYGGEDIYSKSISDIEDPELGLVPLKISSSDTEGFPLGTHPSEVKITNSAGEPFYSDVFKSRVESTLE